MSNLSSDPHVSPAGSSRHAHLVKVSRWPSETPLFGLVLVAALALWVVLAVSIVGLVYALFIGLFFFLAHLAFIAHLRGSAVRLGPDQFPALYERIGTLSKQLGMRNVPEAYVMQAGGSLNAFATRFLGSSFIVLFADLLDACGDNTEARDFIIAHELGHLRAGHLNKRWLLLPGLMVPLLGSAWSRACEYTADRYGASVGRDREAALEGLCILAAGAKQGPQVNRRALVAQRVSLNTVTMKLGEWFASHPPLARRLAVLAPELSEKIGRGHAAAVGAGLVVVLAMAVPFGGSAYWVKTVLPQMQAQLAAQRTKAAKPQTTTPPTSDARSEVERGIMSLVEAAESLHARQGRWPAHADELYATWRDLHPGEDAPQDPYTGDRYQYQLEDGRYVVWSSGPNAQDDSDNLYYASPEPGGATVE